MEDNVELTGYMCAWADEKEHVDIVKGEEIELLRISYGMDHVEAIMPGDLSETTNICTVYR